MSAANAIRSSGSRYRATSAGSPATECEAAAIPIHGQLQVARSLGLQTVIFKSFEALVNRILRSTALFGASRRIAARMDVPWQFPAFASRSLQSLPKSNLS